MIHDRRLLAGVLSIVFGVAACGGTAATATPAAPSETTPPAASAPAEASAAPTEQPAATDNGSNSGPGSASDLEAMLPDEAGGVTFTKGSFDGAAIAGLGFLDAGELDPILTANGKTLADVRMAVATPADASGGASTIIFALQVRDLPVDQLLEMGGVASSGADLQTVTISGKQVQRGGVPGFMVYVYAKNDTLFEILFATDTVAEAVIAKLP